MNAIGGKEVLMPLMHPAENWKKTADVLYSEMSIPERKKINLFKKYLLYKEK